MSNILVYRHSKHGTFTNIAMANECPCLSAAPTSSNTLLSCDQVYHTVSSWCVYSLSKIGNDGLKLFTSTVLHKPLCGCNTEPDEMYIVYNTVTSVGQLACKTKHSICKHACAITFIYGYDTYCAALS